MVRIAVSALHNGPPELAVQLPVSGTLTRRLPDPNGWQVWIVELDWPVRFHIPLDAHPGDASLTVEFDEHGPFLWVRAVAVAGGSESLQGVRQLRVHLAYVLNPEEVDDLSSPYIGAVGEAYIDDVTVAAGPEPPAPGADAEARIDTEIGTANETSGTSGAGDLPEAGSTLGYDEVDGDLEVWVSQLAAVAAAAPEVIPDLISDAEQAPGYVLNGASATYYGLAGTPPRTTDNRQELVYWIVDDLAAGLARAWATAAPAYNEGNPSAVHALWLGRWHNLMSALSTDWGERTRARIEQYFLNPS
ncbi:hypothetical protein Mycsm_06899 (plasmid) [Mycobacterium sp. JS623]|uniref:hypothetical protein n=1 Tax=Mycobacterium sp. JS623 TaxID=212767 RepID=UPI0002A5A7CA|nr:hypothetical protein [Mycobacterium sp. JS623]AGB27002.1 hypothetical protein Mycsm_06899 [Mycobacterium sp. JS623]